jgi:hypothetical protein
VGVDAAGSSAEAAFAALARLGFGDVDMVPQLPAAPPLLQPERADAVVRRARKGSRYQRFARQVGRDEAPQVIAADSPGRGGVLASPLSQANGGGEGEGVQQRGGLTPAEVSALESAYGGGLAAAAAGPGRYAGRPREGRSVLYDNVLASPVLGGVLNPRAVERLLYAAEITGVDPDAYDRGTYGGRRVRTQPGRRARSEG